MADEVEQEEFGQEEFEAEVDHEDQAVETFGQFKPEWRLDFEGLAWIGYLEDVVEIPAHKFVLRTLTVGEKLQVAQVCKEFEGTLGYARAWKAACVAAALQLVDGKPLTVPNKTVGIVRQKFEYVVNTWFDPIIDLLYERQDALEGRVLEITRELGILGGTRRVTQLGGGT